jgi:hydrogenase maturation protease
MNILVLGIGQSMRGDDAAGLEAVQQWQARYPTSADRVNVEFSELPGLTLLDLLAGMDAAILVDAVHSSMSVGTVLRLGPDELESFSPETTPSHGWGVAETLHIGFSLYPWLRKCKITLIGIVGGNFGFGAGIKPELAAGIKKAGEMVEGEIQALNEL